MLVIGSMFKQKTKIKRQKSNSKANNKSLIEVIFLKQQTFFKHENQTSAGYF